MIPTLRHLMAAAFATTVAVSTTSNADHHEKSNRDHLSGSQGAIVWESLLGENGLDGWTVQDAPWTPTAWSRDGDTLIADVGEGRRARIIRGDDNWRSYELSVKATLVKGGSLQLWFAISDGRGYHFSTLTGWQTAALIEPDHTKLDVADFAWEYGREYDIVLAVRDKSVHVTIDGQLVNRITLPHRAKGAIGLAAWGKGTVAKFRTPWIRHYFIKK